MYCIFIIWWNMKNFEDVIWSELLYYCKNVEFKNVISYKPFHYWHNIKFQYVILWGPCDLSSRIKNFDPLNFYQWVENYEDFFYLQVVIDVLYNLCNINSSRKLKILQLFLCSFTNINIILTIRIGLLTYYLRFQFL